MCALSQHHSEGNQPFSSAPYSFCKSGVKTEAMIDEAREDEPLLAEGLRVEAIELG